MNNQEVFNKVATHLLTQKVKSREDEMCLYRSSNNTKCAIGCLIPDELYNRDMELYGFYEIPSHFPQMQDIFNGISLYLLNSLQFIHDTTSPSRWKSELQSCAIDNNLSPEILNNFPG